MKIAFFEIEPWEKEEIKKRIKGHKLLFFNSDLTEKNASKFSDVDILYIKSVDKLYEDYIENNGTVGLISFIIFPKANYIPVSFMMGGPSPFFRDTYKSAVKHYNPKVYECAGTHAQEKRKSFPYRLSG